MAKPPKDMVRESIFNLLAHTNKISFKFDKSNILDLYAGSGSFGLEVPFTAINIKRANNRVKEKAMICKTRCQLGKIPKSLIPHEKISNEALIRE